MMDARQPPALEALCREATTCRTCFSNGLVTAPTINIAQPRWIGDGYWSSSPRICVLMLNPGAGSDHNASPNIRMRKLLERFRLGEVSLGDVFKFQRIDFPTWGKSPGHFLEFFRTFKLDIDRIALANVAWCATKGNRYPSWMLNDCMRKFTKRLMDLIRPDVVVLSGSDVHLYEVHVKRVVPNTAIFRTLHYAHRKGREVEAKEAERLQVFLARH